MTSQSQALFPINKQKNIDLVLSQQIRIDDDRDLPGGSVRVGTHHRVGHQVRLPSRAVGTLRLRLGRLARGGKSLESLEIR